MPRISALLMLRSRSPLLRHAYFVARSHTPRNCCVRFVAGVTVGSRNTCYRPARYGLTRTGLAPVGLHQLLLAPSEIQASLVCKDVILRSTTMGQLNDAAATNFLEQIVPVSEPGESQSLANWHDAIDGATVQAANKCAGARSRLHLAAHSAYCRKSCRLR